MMARLARHLKGSDVDEHLFQDSMGMGGQRFDRWDIMFKLSKKSG